MELAKCFANVSFSTNNNIHLYTVIMTANVSNFST